MQHVSGDLLCLSNSSTNAVPLLNMFAFVPTLDGSSNLILAYLNILKPEMNSCLMAMGRAMSLHIEKSYTMAISDCSVGWQATYMRRNRQGLC